MPLSADGEFQRIASASHSLHRVRRGLLGWAAAAASGAATGCWGALQGKALVCVWGGGGGGGGAVPWQPVAAQPLLSLSAASACEPASVLPLVACPQELLEAASGLPKPQGSARASSMPAAEAGATQDAVAGQPAAGGGGIGLSSAVLPKPRPQKEQQQQQQVEQQKPAAGAKSKGRKRR